jgi:hypothetical protein
MALARFDWARERMVFASVGNIEARVLSQAEPVKFIIRRGIVGLNAPGALVTEYPWSLGNVLVLHSDGLRTHWGWRDFPGLAGQPADIAAQTLLGKLAKAEDDATALVVRNAIT